MRGRLNILYLAPEVSPFAKSGDLADIAGALPKFIKGLGHDIRVMMPNYRSINERKYVVRDVIRLQGLEVKLGKEKYEANGKSSFIPNSKVQIYFLDNKSLFDKEGLYCDPKTGKEYSDNPKRFLFFCRACLETLKLLHWQPDIIHCNEWQTAVIPLFLKELYKEDQFFNHTKTLLTVHDFTRQGEFSKSTAEKLGLSDIFADQKNGPSFLNLGLRHADLINTVSETHAKEVLDNNKINNGISELLKKRKKDFVGIPSGVDYEVWDPETDKAIPHQYSRKDLSAKLDNKKELLQKCELTFDEKIPVLGLISPLNDLSGAELLVEAFDQLMKLDLQFVLMGTAPSRYANTFDKLQKKYGQKFHFHSKFREGLSHLILAGADMFLVPSLAEPSGLQQLQGLKYGIVPVVREAGGLADTVVQFDPKKGSGWGFVFKKYDSDELIKVVKKAIDHFKEQAIWSKIVQNAMKQDFSWKHSVQKYIKLYQRLLSNKK